MIGSQLLDVGYRVEEDDAVRWSVFVLEDMLEGYVFSEPAFKKRFCCVPRASPVVASGLEGVVMSMFPDAVSQSVMATTVAVAVYSKLFTCSARQSRYAPGVGTVP